MEEVYCTICPHCGTGISSETFSDQVCSHCDHKLRTHGVHEDNKQLMRELQEHRDVNDTLISALMYKDQQYIDAIVHMVDLRDSYTGSHSVRVETLSGKIAVAMGVKLSDIERLKRCAKLHDIGKVYVPDSILCKPSRLTEEEENIIQEHTVKGAKLMAKVPSLNYVVPVIRNHHEWWDGTGYPDGLKGTDTHLWARIVAIADAVDSMYISRPYRTALFEKQVRDELNNCAGTQFDPSIIDAVLNAKTSLGIFIKMDKYIAD
jgi:putative nucleotidyltransferase with HDIG domain